VVDPNSSHVTTVISFAQNNRSTNFLGAYDEVSVIIAFVTRTASAHRIGSVFPKAILPAFQHNPQDHITQSSREQGANASRKPGIGSINAGPQTGSDARDCSRLLPDLE